MSIKEKLEVITDKIYEKGKKDEQSEFWDAYMGEDNDYSYRFAGRGWTDKTFAPNRDIILSGTAPRIFSVSSISDLEGILQRQGVRLDTSKATRLDGAFYYCRQLTVVPEIVVGENCTTISDLFGASNKLHTIRKLTLPDKTMTITGMFSGCTNLQNIEIGGVIANSFAIGSAPLTVASMESIISHLKNYSGTSNAMKYTLTFNSDCWSRLNASELPDGFDAWQEYVNSLGWIDGVA